MSTLLPVVARVQDTYIDPIADCWVSGHTRSSCCYGRRKCFDDIERCCSAPLSRFGPLIKLLNRLPPVSARLLQQVLTFSQTLAATGVRSPVAATYLVHESWKQAQTQLDRARNETLFGKQGELPSMETAFGATLTYFVSLHALHRSMRPMQAMLRREVRMWSRFTSIYVAAWGRRDFCRCVEAAEFYSRSSSQLLQTGMGQLHFPRVLLNGSLWEHQALSLQNCRVQDEKSLEAETLLSIAFSSQCIPGDLSTLIGLLHGCILEKELTKVLSLHESIFQLATFVQDCLDNEMWGFSVRDAALHHAKLVWDLLKKDRVLSHLRFDERLQKRIAWAPRSLLFRQRLTGMGPWHSQCGPHFLEFVQLLSEEHGETPHSHSHGPFCTEYGRFWLYLNHHRNESADHGILMVVPITMSWEANPWHHVHWWLPLMYCAKIFLKLDQREVDVALVFPHASVDFALSTAKGRDIDVNFRGHTEPSIWSILQHDFPFDNEKTKLHWSPQGIHAGLLKWISDRPAMPLAKYYGRSYQQVIMGLPSIRSFLQTPQLPCTSITQVKQWIQFAEAMPAMPISKSAGACQKLCIALQFQICQCSTQHLLAGLQLAVLQRPETDGRRIQNYDEAPWRVTEIPNFFRTCIDLIQ